MNDKEHEINVQVLRQLYGDLYAEHGDRPEGVGWSSGAAQLDRFDAVIAWDERKTHPNQVGAVKLLDVGCGTGRFCGYVHHGRPLTHLQYTGIDILPQYIEAANKSYGAHTKYDGTFHVAAAKRWAEVEGENSYNIVTGIGTIGWWFDPYHLLTDMWYMAKDVMVFTWNDKTSRLSIPQVLSFAESVGAKSWNINHTYNPDDWCVHLYKDEELALAGKMEQSVAASA